MQTVESRAALDESAPLSELRAHFRATSTLSMPLAGAITWFFLGASAPFLTPQAVGILALYIMAVILPLAFLLERFRGRNLFAGGNSNPLLRLFLVSIVGIGLTVPVVVIGANGAGNPTIVVLGMAILAGVIWIPFGWAAGDPVGLRHAIARGVGSYAAFALAPAPYETSAICGVVVMTYLYSLLFMRRVGADEAELQPS